MTCELFIMLDASKNTVLSAAEKRSKTISRIIRAKYHAIIQADANTFFLDALEKVDKK